MTAGREDGRGTTVVKEETAAAAAACGSIQRTDP